MDDIDLGIMDELIKDAQVSFSLIAEHIGTSTETVRKRYDRMKQRGIILQSSISVDFRKLGFDGLAVLMITSRNSEKTVEGLRKTRNIIAINRTFGEHDLMVFALTRGVDDLFNTVSLVRGIDQVEVVEVILCRLTASFPGGTIIHRLEAPLLAQRKQSN
jgi:Lrp/AsnC family transcriptional regulator, regulator for asnA, asnC and gidA